MPQPTSFSRTLRVTLLAIVLATPAAIGLAGASRHQGRPDTPQSAQDPCAQVLVAQGNAEGLHRRQVWTQDTLGVEGTAEPDDRFGSALY